MKPQFWKIRRNWKLLLLPRLLEVDGVAPTAENIASGEYPLCVDVLAGISASAADDSPERALWLWLQGGVGQAFISSQGYLEAE